MQQGWYPVSITSRADKVPCYISVNAHFLLKQRYPYCMTRWWSLRHEKTPRYNIITMRISSADIRKANFYIIDTFLHLTHRTIILSLQSAVFDFLSMHRHRNSGSYLKKRSQKPAHFFLLVPLLYPNLLDRRVRQDIRFKTNNTSSFQTQHSFKPLNGCRVYFVKIFTTLARGIK